MLANTTISEIRNEVKGVPDDQTDASNDERDYIRRITVEGVSVSLVTKSYEWQEPLFRDALIVVSKVDSDAGPPVYSVWRYWQNIYTNWIESELLFATLNGPYDDIFVFDKYAVVVKDEATINAIYFDLYRGKLVPNYLE